MGSHDPIAYIYDADHHCPACAEKRFGRTDDGFIAGQNDDGSESTDSEGNPVSIIAPWDEWCSGELGCETLVCGDCGGLIDTAHDDPHSPGCEDYEAPELSEIIMDYYRLSDGGDEWGRNREFGFGIAFALYFRGEEIPDDWRFVPGEGITEERTRDECDVANEMLTEYDTDAVTGDELRAFGDWIDTEADRLEAAGKSY